MAGGRYSAHRNRLWLLWALVVRPIDLPLAYGLVHNFGQLLASFGADSAAQLLAKDRVERLARS